MKYCINYRRDIKCKNEVDELRIDYNRNDSTLFDFISVHKDQRINIVINDVKEIIKLAHQKNIVAARSVIFESNIFSNLYI